MGRSLSQFLASSNRRGHLERAANLSRPLLGRTLLRKSKAAYIVAAARARLQIRDRPAGAES